MKVGLRCLAILLGSRGKKATLTRSAIEEIQYVGDSSPSSSLRTKETADNKVCHCFN